MDIKSWVAEIKNPLRTLNNLNLLLDEQNVIIRPGADRVARIGYPDDRLAESIIVSKLEFGSIEEYINQLKTRSYSVLLIDGSFLQISIDIERGNLIKHRYCYYPCPINFREDELIYLTETESIWEVIRAFLGSPQFDVLLRSPVRIDFNSNRWEPGEPHAHVHLNSSKCRVALSAPISPSYFIKFIFRQFYANLWSKYPVLEDLSQDIFGYCLKKEEEEFLYITARRAFDAE